MSLGKRLVKVTQRSRWLLFSSLVEVPDNLKRRLPAPRKEDTNKQDRENAVFENEFFRTAKRASLQSQT